MRAARIAAATFAALACAWFALAARQAHEISRATDAVAGTAPLAPPAAAAARGALDAAAVLNPDREVDILRGRVALLAGDARGARRILGAVTRAEPQNLEAWLWLAHAAGDDRPLFYDALVHARHLEPLVRAAR